MRDLKSNIKVVPTLVPGSRNAAGNGVGVDTLGFNSVAVVFASGAIGGSGSPSFPFEVQESADNINFTAVSAVDMRGANPVVTAAGTTTVVSYIGNKRYVRAALKTVAGTSPTLDCSALVLLAGATNRPIAQ
jgi:hypothetical protein